MKYNRTELAEGIGFSSIIDEKFKTQQLTVRFIMPLCADTAAANSLGMGVLSSSNKKYKTLALLNEKLSSLYGAGLSTFTHKRGDVQILGISASWINSRYAFDGEDMDSEMLGIIKDCIFSPNAENGEFDSDSFRITKNDLLDRIDAELNNKRGYALSRAAETAFKGEPAENSCYGTKASAEAVTSAAAYNAYKSILSEAQIEIYFVSPEDNPIMAETMKECFAATERSPKAVAFIAKSPLRPEPVTVSDEYDVRQCKMVMTFKNDCEDRFAMKLFSVIFGETPVSKLFMNVREKLSLCYYCACRVNSPKGALTVDIGVERENIEKAKAEILAQLEAMCKGDFTDEDIANALLSLENSHAQVGDIPSSYEGWYFERFCDGTENTPEQQFNCFKEVTKERIIEAARSVKLDSVYIMLDRKEAE